MYFPGCSAKSLAREYDESAKLIASKLGIELLELNEANCCGAIELPKVNDELWLALNARILSLASSRNLPLVTICNGCLLNLKKARRVIEAGNLNVKKIFNALSKIGLRYSSPKRITHLLEVIVKDVGLERLKSYVKRALDNLKIATFPGCQLLRPSNILSLDNPESPHLLDDLVKTLGAKALEYNEKNKCCGGPILLEDERITLSRVRLVIESAVNAGADCIVVACPLCHLTLDAGQLMASHMFNLKLNLPILYFTQLIGLALGEDPAKLGLNKHIISTRRIIEAII